MSRIPLLPAAAQLTGTETIPLVQGGVTKRASYSEFATPIVAEASAIRDQVAASLAGTQSRLSTLEANFVTSIDPDFAQFTYAIVDEVGTVLEIYDLKGENTGANSADLYGETEFLGGVGTPGAMITDIDSDFVDESVLLMVDSANKVVQRVTPTGRSIFPGGVSAFATDSGTEGVAPAPTVRRPRVHETYGADINHFLMNGQSLSIRSSFYVNVQDATDLAFSGGIGLAVTETANTLVPIGSVAAEHGVIYNAMQQMKFLIQGSADYSPDDDYLAGYYRTLVSSHGTGGVDIAALVKGGSSTSYEAALLGVTEATRLARAAGKMNAVQAFSWMHGEANRLDTVAAYKAAFLAMLNDYRADIVASTTQTHDFLVFTYQPSGQQYDRPAGTMVANNVAQAFFEASEADPRIIIAAPMYQATHADDLHQDLPGGRLIGQQWGKVLYKRVYRGEDWRPLEPIKITKHSPRVVTVKFNVPDGPLVLDTVNVTNPGNFGFTIKDNVGFINISAVEIVNADTVRITTSTDIGVNPLVGYAFYGIGGNGGGPIEGARGNLRDSDPTVALNAGDNLWNWGVAFEKPVPYVKGS